MNEAIEYIYNNENEDRLTGKKNGLISREDAIIAVNLALEQVKNNDSLHSVISCPKCLDTNIVEFVNVGSKRCMQCKHTW
tara:strand:+ start:1319 stop:1558 length:240 start_codon:yes stop_codon:yes gene_type:complete